MEHLTTRPAPDLASQVLQQEERTIKRTTVARAGMMIIPLAWILTTTKWNDNQRRNNEEKQQQMILVDFFSHNYWSCVKYYLLHFRIARNDGSVLLTEQGSSKLAIAILVNQWKEQQQQRQEQQQQHGRSSWRTNFSQKPFLAASETEVIIIPHLNCLQKAVSSLNWYKLAIPKMIILSFMFLLWVLDDQIEDDVNHPDCTRITWFGWLVVTMPKKA